MQPLVDAIIDATRPTPAIREAYATQVARFEPDIRKSDQDGFPELFGQYQQQVSRPDTIPQLLNVVPGSVSTLVEGDALNNYLNMPLTRPVERILVHNLGLPASSFRGESSLRALWNWDVVKRSMRHLASHWIVGPDGSTWTGRPMNWSGAHGGVEGNVGSIGIALWLDGAQEAMTQAQLNSLCKLMVGLSKGYGFSPAWAHMHRGIGGCVPIPGSKLDETDMWTCLIENVSEEHAIEENVEIDGLYRNDKFRCAVVEGSLWAEVSSLCTTLGLTETIQGTPWPGALLYRMADPAQAPLSLPVDGRLYAYVVNRVVRMVKAKEQDGEAWAESLWVPLRPVVSALKGQLEVTGTSARITI